MKTNQILISSLRTVSLLLAFLSIVSFVIRPGGDRVSVYRNGKLLFEQFLHVKEEKKTIAIQPAEEGVIAVEYSHCGKIGSARVLMIKDANEQVVKTWKFSNVEREARSQMTFKVADVPKSKTSGGKMKLLYHSSELTEPFLVAYLQVDRVQARVN